MDANSTQIHFIIKMGHSTFNHVIVPAVECFLPTTSEGRGR